MRIFIVAKRRKRLAAGVSPQNEGINDGLAAKRRQQLNDGVFFPCCRRFAANGSLFVPTHGSRRGLSAAATSWL